LDCLCDIGAGKSSQNGGYRRELAWSPNHFSFLWRVSGAARRERPMIGASATTKDLRRSALSGAARPGSGARISDHHMVLTVFLIALFPVRGYCKESIVNAGNAQFPSPIRPIGRRRGKQPARPAARR